METTDRRLDALLAGARGKKVKSAASSLNSFAIELDDGSALLANATSSEAGPAILVSVVNASALPKLADAVCSVDWSWLSASTIEQIDGSRGWLKLMLLPAGPLTISVAVWQGAPFLAFQPFRPAQAK